MVDLDGITVVTETAKDMLNHRQEIDYRTHRENCLEWLLTFGKAPAEVEGYARSTVKTRGARMDMFYRWVWADEDQYTTDVTHEHADRWLKQLAKRE